MFWEGKTLWFSLMESPTLGKPLHSWVCFTSSYVELKMAATVCDAQEEIIFNPMLFRHPCVTDQRKQPHVA